MEDELGSLQTGVNLRESPFEKEGESVLYFLFCQSCVWLFYKHVCHDSCFSLAVSVAGFTLRLTEDEWFGGRAGQSRVSSTQLSVSKE